MIFFFSDLNLQPSPTRHVSMSGLAREHLPLLPGSLGSNEAGPRQHHLADPGQRDDPDLQGPRVRAHQRRRQSQVRKYYFNLSLAH